MTSKQSKKEALQWCSDHLHDILGFTDSALASYLVSVATKSHSSAAVLQVLREGQVQAPLQRLETFAQQLLSQTKPKAASSAARKTNADWEKSAAAYSLVDDPLLDEQQASSSKKKNKKTKKDKSKEESRDSSHSKKPSQSSSSSSRRRKRRYSESDDDDNGKGGKSSDDDVADGAVGGIDRVRQRAEERREKRRQRKEQERELTPEEKAELEREKDLQERDEFVKRMLDRDQAKNSQKQAAKDAAYEKRLAREAKLASGETIVDDETGEEVNIDRLREASRSAYLKEREKREVELLKQQLADEEEMFRGAKLTDAERKRNELGKQILKMVSKREADEDKDDGYYRVPDEIDETQRTAQNKARLTSRYVDTGEEKTEQQLWEESQTQKAAGLTSKKKKAAKSDEYDFVMEEEIDFVMQGTKEGYDQRDEKHRRKLDKKPKPEKLEVVESRPMTEHEKILEGRKKLPVFAYREEFLAALKDHQVLILVGETGSGKVRKACLLFYALVSWPNQQQSLTLFFSFHFADYANPTIFA